jgi:SAM-dependent methyltransferase
VRDAGTSPGLQDHFSGLAEDWADRYVTRDSFATRLRTLSAALREQVHADDAVLDFGSGAGVFSAVLSGYAGRVVSMDVNEAMLHASAGNEDQLAEIAAGVGVAYRPHLVSRVVAHSAALRAAPQFDVVVAIAVLEYVPDLQDVLTALAATLRPGGTLLATYPDQRSIIRRVERPVDLVSSAVGRRLGSRRLGGREYSELRPEPVTDLAPVLRRAGLTVAGTRRVPLGSRGVRRRLAPNCLWIAHRGAPDRLL